MLVSSTDEFQAFMFEQLHFLPEMNGNYTGRWVLLYLLPRGVLSAWDCGLYDSGGFFGFFSESCETASVWGNAFREDAF